MTTSSESVSQPAREQVALPAAGDWGAMRSQMPVASRWAYFDHAAVAPLSLPACAAIQAWASEAAEQGDTVWPSWAKRIEQVRGLSAELIGAHPDEIALVHNTTAGINLVAEGFPWEAGDNVVTLANEFPSNLYPWLNLEARGVQVRQVPVEQGRVDLNRLAELCDARTRIVSLSWVGYASGWRIDPAAAARVAHDAGALFFLDAIQGLGVFPLHARNADIDFLAADGHKWLLGPEGAGIFYCRREHLARLRPLSVGWNSVQQGSDFAKIELKLRDTAARYEGGSQNMVGFAGLGASLEMLRVLGAGPEHSLVGDRVLFITDLICRRLGEIGAKVASHRTGDQRSGIVSFEMPDRSPTQVRARGLAQGIVMSCRDGRLRLSPHAYVNEADVERLVASLQKTE